MSAVAIESPALTMWRFEGRSMASPLRLTIVAPAGLRGRRLGELAWSLVEDEFAVADAALSRFRADSAVTALNRRAKGDPLPVGRRLRVALAASRRAWRITDGRFDPRILPVLDRLGYPGAPIAADGPRDDLAGDWLSLDSRSGRAAVRSPVDLGGIGKGLALRWAAGRVERILEADPTTASGYLLEAGGDIVLRGPAPDGGPWLVGVERPEIETPVSAPPHTAPDAAGDAPAQGPAEHVAVVALERGAICTSSSSFLRWLDPDGRLVHHLIDPSTGEPGGDGLVSVTVAAADAAWAEVWSKVLFLAGRRSIAELARHQGLAAWWVDDDGVVSMTPAARLRTVWAV